MLSIFSAGMVEKAKNPIKATLKMIKILECMVRNTLKNTRTCMLKIRRKEKIAPFLSTIFPPHKFPKLHKFHIKARYKLYLGL